MRSRYILLAFLVFAIITPSVLAAPTLTYPRVTPTAGEEGTTFTFTVHFKGDTAPASMQVFLDDQAFDMLEVDAADDNYTDGKDYYFEQVLESGTTIYFYKAMVDGEPISTTALTVHVKVDEGFKFTHLDVVLAVIVFMIPVIIALLIFRRISRDMHEMLEELKKNRD